MDSTNALRYDPFAGDDCDSRILADQIVTARKAAKCHQCAEVITPGQRVRSRREIVDGSFMAFKWCQTCTELMAKGDDDALEKRIPKKDQTP